MLEQNIVSLVYGTLIGLSLAYAGYGGYKFWTEDFTILEIRRKIKQIRKRAA